MNSRHIPLSLLLSPLFLSMTFAAAPAAAADGAALAEQHCARCHGSDGLATGPGLPHLNGQLASYLTDAIGKLQKGRLPTAVPQHVPAGLETADIAALAEHYAGVRAARPAQEVDPAKLAKGEAIYRDRCADCHIDNGREADKDAPLMAGQKLDYLLTQSGLFLDGKRKFGFLQDDAFKGLSRDDVEAVAHFFASQEQYVATKAGAKKKQRR